MFPHVGFFVCTFRSLFTAAFYNSPPIDVSRNCVVGQSRFGFPLKPSRVREGSVCWFYLENSGNRSLLTTVFA